MPRWAAKVDSTHAIVVAALRAHGWTVLSLARMGQGVPDLLIARDGRTMLAEVKTAKGRLRAAQLAFTQTWPGEWVVLRSIADVQTLNQSGQATVQPIRGGSAVSPGDSA